MQGSKTLTILALSLAALALPAAAPIQRLIPHDYQVASTAPRGTAESTRMVRMTAADTLNVAIGLPLRNVEALANLRSQLHDPASPMHHSWLTTEEFASQFSPTQDDYAAVVAWAQSKGLEIVNQAPNRLILNVRGSAPAIEAAFGVQMHTYQTPEGRAFHSPDRAPSMDLNVAIDSINGLNNLVKPVSRLKHNAEVSAAPHAGSGTGGLYIGKDFRAAYAAGVPTTTTGSGQGIALFEFSEFYPVDVSSYFATAGITEPSITVVSVAGGVTSSPYGGEDEVALDIDVAGSLAPGASIYVYEGEDGTTILNQIITDGKCKSVGVSWGWASDNMTTQTSIDSTQDAVFAAMDTAGIACFVAAGDSATWTTTQWAQKVTSSSFNPINPADEPTVTCVGATELSTASAGGAWSAEVVWPDCGGGYSHRYAMPAYQSTGITWSAITGASTTMRNCPDVTSVGDNLYLNYNDGKEVAQSVGGTSCAAPLWAAFAALTNQTALLNGVATLGYINPILYKIGTGSSYATSIHDITSGTDGIASGVGIDMASGWGSPVGMTTINALLANNVASTTPTVAISPTAASIAPSATEQFTATVGNTTNTAVTWTCSGGTVTSAGLYTAPATAGTYTVKVTSAADTAVSATAPVTVATAGVTLKISPTTASIVEKATEQFTATVSGSTNTSVTWTASGGTISTKGLFTAPSKTGTFTVTATSVANTSVKASATVTVKR